MKLLYFIEILLYPGCKNNKIQRNFELWDQENYFVISVFKKKKIVHCCPLPTDRKMRKNRVGLFILFFMNQIWAKNLLKLLYSMAYRKALHKYAVLTPAFRQSWVPFRNKKNIGKLNSLTVRKKKKKKNWPTDPIFKFWSGEGNITNFFLALYQCSL